MVPSAGEERGQRTKRANYVRYLLVGNADTKIQEENDLEELRDLNVNADADASADITALATSSRYARFLFDPICNDDDFTSIWEIDVVEGTTSVRFVKFLLWTGFSMFLTFHIVRAMGWEHDSTLSWKKLMVFDLTNMILDIGVFFVVGRLYKDDRQGIDYVAWLAVSLLGSLYASFSSTFDFLKHSVSLYDMHCHWPCALWVFVTCLVPGIGLLIGLHVRYALQYRLFFIKAVELTLTVILFLMPVASSPNFHFHHWFAGWLLGMHCNFSPQWSRLLQAWCWGQYINGVAVWGRDPLLGCAYAYYASLNQHCNYLECYSHEVLNPEDNTTHLVVNEMPVPDWRNCSAAGNYAP